MIQMPQSLADGREPTAEEVGNHFKVPRERMRQIGNKAPRKFMYREERRRTLGHHLGN
ncbi:hypothetical protein [Deinococcus hopiensis]|uniref:hypothetical protein n=1 Tax=Deinococcus hopiensis TaxID=309885 RepID=UPI0031830B00